MRCLQQFAKCGRTLPAVLLLLFCVASLGLAQNAGSGDIRGTVTDPTGAVIPGATVTMVETTTGVMKTLTTNDAGIYDSVSVLAGTYRLTFTRQGFGTLVRDGITVNVGVTTINAQLTLGANVQQVEVTGQATLLATETGQQGTSLLKDTMVQLPNVGQDWVNFTKTLAGVEGTGASVSVNGNMPYNSNFLTDGGAITYPQSSNVDTAIFETVAEVQINTASFDAQYGIGGSVFNEITKSGSNSFHGAAYWYLQNNFFNARSFFAAVANQRWDDYGGSVGGPIRKNKFFFYFNTDRTVNKSVGYSYGTYATAGMQAGNFSGAGFPTIYDPSTINSQNQRSPFPGNNIPSSRIDPMAAKLQGYFPVPNQPGLANNWYGALPTSSPLARFFGRLDYNINDKHRLTGYVMERDAPFRPPIPGWSNPACPPDCQAGDVDAQHIAISEVWTVSSSTVNEFRAALARQGNWFNPYTQGAGWPAKLGWSYAYADVPPVVSIAGTGGFSWGNGAVAATLTEASYEPSDVVTMIKGRHILKFGGEFLAEQDNSTIWGNVQSGQFTFSGAYTEASPFGAGGLGYADFLLGQVASWNATNSPEVGMRMKTPQLFAQDDFKVTPHLTINLGLRYQYQRGWNEVHNRLGVFDPTIQNSVSGNLGAMWFAGQDGRRTLQNTKPNIVLPRIGFAWSPKPKLAIRGGFGIYSYLWSLDNYGANAQGFGFGGSGSAADNTGINPVFLLSSHPSASQAPYVLASQSPTAYNGLAVNYYPYNTPVSRSYEWSFSIQRELPGSLLAEAAYVGSHANGLPFDVDFNELHANQLSQVASSGNPQLLRPYPQFLGINGDTFNATSIYHSLQLSLNKRFSHGLSYNANFTWSKMLSEQDSSGWGRIAGSPIYQDAYNPSANYGPSLFNVPKMLKGSLAYQLPVGKGKSYLNQGGVLDAILGGWQASGIFVLDSGTPFTPVWGGTNLSGAAPNGNLYLNGFSAAESWYANVVGNWHVSNPNINEWFNPAAFAQPAPYTFGDAGRNSLSGPDLRSLDFSMGKSFRIPKLGEASELKLRFDATNALNHPCFSNPSNLIGTQQAGTINSTTVGGRVLQLGARFSF